MLNDYLIDFQYTNGWTITNNQKYWNMATNIVVHINLFPWILCEANYFNTWHVRRTAVNLRIYETNYVDSTAGKVGVFFLFLCYSIREENVSQCNIRKEE